MFFISLQFVAAFTLPHQGGNVAPLSGLTTWQVVTKLNPRVVKESLHWKKKKKPLHH